MMACRMGKRYILPTFCAVICFTVLYDRFISRSDDKLTQNVLPRNSVKINNIRKVIILSYMRSGTSLLGQLFNSNPESLYVFEPLWYTCAVAVPNYIPFHFLNGTIKSAPRSCIDAGVEIVESYLNCDMYNINTGTLQSSWHLEQGEKTRDFNRCGLTRRCLKKFRQVCLESKIRATKVIRMRLEDVKPLLEKYPELKVIHLVRDPRGIIQSRIKIHEYYKSPRITGAEVCGDMLRDEETYKQFSVFFPDRVFQVRYEDFASEPIKYSEKIYSFLNLSMPDRTKQWLNIAMYGNASRQTGDFETSKQDPAKVSYGWRETISWDLVSWLHVSCRKVLATLLYAEVTDETQLRNRAFPLRSEMCKDTGSVMVCPTL